jgi:cytochrome c biogenesis protein CcmG, thiol:disulfide interchange protein DsbE
MSEISTTQSLPAERSRPRWGHIIAWTGLLVLLGVVGTALYLSGLGPAADGQRAPNFSLTTFEGEEISSQSLRGKVIVINFWASWCKPCEQEAADLETAWKYYEPRGDVIFLGVAYVDTAPESKAYLEKFAITYPNGPDLRTRISQSFRILGVPETYVIDKNGILVNKQKGPFLNLAQIRAFIDPYLD